MAPPSPTLYRLVSEEWREKDVLINHIKKHPEDLIWQDRYGNNAFHRLCTRRQHSWNEGTVDIVEAIINACPDLVATQNDAGWTPLHFCVERRLVLKQDKQLVRMALLMIQACPEASSLPCQGFKRMTPFHLACEADADISVLRAMLQSDPSLATRSCLNESVHSSWKSPVQLLWQANDTAMDKMALLLLTSFEGHAVDDPMPMNHILHAACSERCPRTYLLQIMKGFPTLASQPDNRGNLPLHYAVRHASVESQGYTKFVLELLLDLYPEAAARRDDNGRLPLHVALSGNSRLTYYKGGIDKLVAANPDALYTLDAKDRLYPVLTSAMYALESRLHLSTTYELLLAAPGVLRHALDNKTCHAKY
jgi:ankyrin repeat protein